MFRAYDVRGVYGKEITPQSFYSLGKALESFSKEIIVGMDYRRNNALLAGALLEGFGGKETFVGFASTPEIVFNSERLGVSLTASHNPPEYNGLKPFTEKRPFFAEELSLLKKKFEEVPKTKESFSKKLPAQDESLREAYLDSLPEFKGGVFDLAGGAVCSIAKVFPEAIFSEPDESFVRHSPEPTQDALGVLIRETEKRKCLGFAFDGDGDRCAVVDSGKLIDSGVLAAFYCEKFLKKGSKVVLTLDVQEEVFEFLQKQGFEPEYSAIGDIFVLKRAQEIGAAFTAEKGGHYSDLKHMPHSDGIYFSAALSQAKAGEINEFSKQFKNVFLSDKIPDVKVDFSNLAELVEGMNPLKIETIDGVKAVFDDYTLLIRASNTQPIVRVSVEARDNEKGISGIAVAKRLVSECKA